MNLPRIPLLLGIGVVLSVTSGYVVAEHFTGHVDVTLDEVSERAQKVNRHSTTTALLATE